PDVALASSRVGTTIGRYRIEALLGQGGMGVVYRAHDTALARDVALKLISPDRAGDADRHPRLLPQARSAAALRHPNIVVVHDVGEHEGSPYVVMELVRGKSLREFVGKDEPDPTTRLVWLGEVARALEAAHDAKVVHRDVKPENVIVT